jgi:hypothetical protein
MALLGTTTACFTLPASWRLGAVFGGAPGSCRDGAARPKELPGGSTSTRGTTCATQQSPRSVKTQREPAV